VIKRWTTPGLCDAHPDVRVLTSDLRDYGGRTRFAGPVVVVRCHDRDGLDDSLTRELCASRGSGRVLVLDAAGIRSRAVLDAQMAREAATNGWAGFVVHGVVREVQGLRHTPIAVKALGVSPLGCGDRNGGTSVRDVPAEFGSVVFGRGDLVYADESGVVVSDEPL
jgi:regulator of ribonuclease activity A